MNKNDRQRIKSAVLDTLQDYNQPLSLPLPIKTITKHFKNIRLIPYSKQMKRRGLSYEEMLDFTGTDDACTDYDAKSGLYIIYYNDCDPSRTDTRRYRWNIAHELGHVRLGHHKNNPDSRLYRNRLSESVYKALEAEADMFAAYILVPHIVLNCLEVTEDFEIAQLCQISDTASLYRANDIKLWKKRGKVLKYDFLVLSHFFEYVESKHNNEQVHMWLSNHRVCRFCNGALSISSYRFCSFCGASVSPKYLSRRAVMQYPGIELDESRRAMECPSCHNTDTYKSGAYCIICGYRIANYCSGALSDNQFVSLCKHDEPLPGNARYCPHCGSKTTFFISKFISSWNGEDPEDDSGDLPF